MNNGHIRCLRLKVNAIASPTLTYVLCSVLLSVNLGESLYGIAQLFGWLHSGHPQFRMTGSFYNPGPFACYLAVTFPMAVRYCIRPPRKYLKWLSVTVLTINILLLPALMSRTAWFAALLGSVIVFSQEMHRKILSRTKTVARTNAIMISATIVILSAIVIVLYPIKKDSADGRLLMWKVGITAVSPSPFTGCGLDRVAGEYGNAQERYFATGKGSPQDRKVADAPEYLFNEYLETSIAFGWGWGMLMIGVLMSAVSIAWSNGYVELAGSMISASIVMAFSYPFQFPISVITIGILLLAAFLSSTLMMTKAVGIVVCLALYLTVVRPNRSLELNSIFSSAHILHKTGKYRNSNDLLFHILPYTSDPMPLVIIGKNHRLLHNPDSAELYFRRASYRCPNRFYPHYLLMQLYLDSMSLNPEKAVIEAETILSKEVKVPSPAIEEMRHEARRVLSELTQ